MSYMFRGAISFDQDLSALNITHVQNMSNMFNGISLSTVNYNSLLIGWDGQSPNSGVVFDGGNSNYNLGGAADTARTHLRINLG
jgi:hypothetical protein